MSEFCSCDNREVDVNDKNYIYSKCLNCGKNIARKSDICKYYTNTGHCLLAEQNFYTYRCRVNGIIKDCVNGVSAEKEIEKCQQKKT